MLCSQARALVGKIEDKQIRGQLFPHALVHAAVRRNAAKANSGITVLPFLADIKVPPPGGLKLDQVETRFSGAWPTRCGSNSGAASQNATTPTVVTLVLSNAGCLHHCG